MTLDEIKAKLSDPKLQKHHRQILEDFQLFMELNNLEDSKDVNPAVLVAAVQKEVISD